jgi:hypothetical protein
MTVLLSCPPSKPLQTLPTQTLTDAYPSVPDQRIYIHMDVGLIQVGRSFETLHLIGVTLYFT